MSGFNIFYPMGWDDNGLPTERRVQDFFNVRCDPDVKSVKNIKEIVSKTKINDTSRTGFPIQTGNRHPISIVKNKIIDIFTQIGLTS